MGLPIQIDRPIYKIFKKRDEKCDVVTIVLIESIAFLLYYPRGIVPLIQNMQCIAVACTYIIVGDGMTSNFFSLVGTTSLHLRHEVDAWLHISVDIGEWIHIKNKNPLQKGTIVGHRVRGGYAVISVWIHIYLLFNVGCNFFQEM